MIFDEAKKSDASACKSQMSQNVRVTCEKVSKNETKPCKFRVCLSKEISTVLSSVITSFAPNASKSGLTRPTRLFFSRAPNQTRPLPRKAQGSPSQASTWTIANVTWMTEVKVTPYSTTHSSLQRIPSKILRI